MAFEIEGDVVRALRRMVGITGNWPVITM